MTILPPEPADEPGISDSTAERDDIPNDAVSAGSRAEQEDYFYGAHDSEAGEQHTLAIGDGDTFVTDEALVEDTAVDVDDPQLARAVAAANFDPDQGVPTEEEVLGRLGSDDDGEDPIPVPA